MSRAVIATPVCARRLREFLDEHAKRGATRFIERLRTSHRAMPENLARFSEMAPARRRKVGGKRVTLRECLLDAGAREFLVLYWVPPEPSDPIVLLDLRIGGQNRFRWKR
ncbi:MAG TPA: hypothetical protein VLS93_10900 [Anaeromyxobacteraceae bacterium]|nr:hypothetical protein [Anaeromyxobacteraceae bacterium]